MIKNNNYCLAATAISEFWDSDNLLAFLGPWCLTMEENKIFLKDKEYIVVPSPWKPALKIKEAGNYCHEIYEELLSQLYREMNSIHQVSYPSEYWRVLLGTWLLHFIEIFYDRYKRIENALKILPDLYMYVLPRGQCNLTTSDTSNLVNEKANDDYYNLILFSLIAYELCPENVIEKEFMPESKIYSIKQGWKKRILCKLINSFALFCKSPLVLSNMNHLTPLDMSLLKWKIGINKISFKDFPPLKENPLDGNYSHKLRRTLRLKKGSDRFQSLLYNLIPDAIPICYMENYGIYRDIFKDIDSIRVVGSAVEWYFNERFKFFASESVSRGAKLIDFQHGGGYGMSMIWPLETMSLEKDIFYTWGWEFKKNNKTKPLPSPHLSRLKGTHSTRLDNILFVGMSMPRYHYRFQSLLQPDDMPKYFEDKKRFFQTLRYELKNRILYRPYHYDYEWGEKKLIKGFCPCIRFVSYGVLVKWMQKVKLVVIDHPHTSFIEALTMNVPSVLFWDHEVYLMRSEAEKYFELLRDAGIIYKDPEEAARKINEIYSNIGLWWQQQEIQEARDQFCHQFALTSKNWRKEWEMSLKTLNA